MKPFKIVLNFLAIVCIYTLFLYSCQPESTTPAVDCECGCEIKYDSILDSRDGHVYKTIKIGSQIWMAENLAYLPEVTPKEEESITDAVYYVYGYEGTDVIEAKANINYSSFGVRYNFPAAMEACPSGWHLPTDGEWTELENYLIANGFNFDGSQIEGDNKIAKSMASCCTWGTTTLEGAIGNDLTKNNSSCFTALPGGGFLSMHYSSCWWSSTEYKSSYAWYRYFTNDSYSLRSSGGYAGEKFSVRCIKD